ncbi:hypothetical protein PSTT_05818 [Puccinia striiformis]|uniref:Uncharacterized protein n=1 Tax=Puccinia striiformis TaxID=27350 RepID=A0A2S4VMS3_9BASI|nr:hypothetical protein PSTT_05818 [Puccinia striiformis]
MNPQTKSASKLHDDSSILTIQQPVPHRTLTKFLLIAYACISSIDCVLEECTQPELTILNFYRSRDLCRIVFASPMWRNTCLANKDEEANKKCLQMASVLHERAFIEPSKTAELWNRAFTFFNHSTTPDSLINQSR